MEGSRKLVLYIRSISPIEEKMYFKNFLDLFKKFPVIIGKFKLLHLLKLIILKKLGEGVEICELQIV